MGQLVRNLTNISVVVFLAFASLNTRVAAGPFEDATAAFNRGDYEAVLRVVRPLADQGNAKAQALLGTMYENGEGMAQDLAEGVKWLRKAAEGGEVSAQDYLGVLYATGDSGLEQDYSQAAKWYRKAADQGDPHAQNSLGSMYAQGEGVPQDYVQAYTWYNLAAKGFSASENERRKWAAFGRDLVASRMTPAQIAEAQKLARERKPKN
jgi:uncharacterized protein